MPRPGPRPYECVRRAWHSDRHQPMRGSIIQQIFRVVHERHSVATKKNREWQEKLPMVVLKAEEIMYSKANSEVEYMDSGTLWDRVNDAIDTIIRRDETAETGQFLPPCIEAALNLGCVAERASRSQRNSNPRSYLGPRTQEPHCVPPKICSRSNNEQNSNLLPIHSANLPTFQRHHNANAASLASEFDRLVIPSINNLSSSSSAKDQINPESNNPFDGGSVYPLYYGTNFQPEPSPPVFHEAPNNVIVGKPIYPFTMEPSEISCVRSFFPCGRDNIQEKSGQADCRVNSGRVPELDCDLSLRLGLSADPGLQFEQGQASCTGNVRPGINFLERGKFKAMSTSNEKEFSFILAQSANNPSGLHTGQWNVAGEGKNAETLVRKRKIPFHDNMELGQFLWQDERTLNHFTGQMKRPGL